MKKFLSNPANIYILIWSINTFQDAAFDSSILSLSLSIPYLCLSLYYILTVLFSYPKGNYLKGLSLFCTLLFIYGLIRFLLGGDLRAGAAISKSYSFLWGLILSIGPIFASYVFTLKGYLSPQNIKPWFIIFLLICFFRYFTSYNEFLINSSSEYNTTTINVGYEFVGLLPLIFIFKKKKTVQFILLGICLYFIISSMKRGAILATVCFLIWFIIQSFKDSKRSSKALMFFLLLICAGLVYYYVSYLYLNNVYFTNKLQGTLEGDSSGRDIIYGRLIHYLSNENNLFRIIFGGGADTTLKIAGIKAHQDWLELAVNCGFIGVVSYLFYWGNSIKELRNSKPFPIFYQMLGGCIIITFLTSLVSMSYDDIWFATALAFGYSTGSLYLLKTNQTSENY